MLKKSPIRAEQCIVMIIVIEIQQISRLIRSSLTDNNGWAATSAALRISYHYEGSDFSMQLSMKDSNFKLQIRMAELSKLFPSYSCCFTPNTYIKWRLQLYFRSERHWSRIIIMDFDNGNRENWFRIFFETFPDKLLTWI